MLVLNSQVPWSISDVFTKSLGLKTSLPVVLLALAAFSCWLVESAERTNHTKSLLFWLTFWSAVRLLHSVLFSWRFGSSRSFPSPPWQLDYTPLRQTSIQLSPGCGYWDRRDRQHSSRKTARPSGRKMVQQRHPEATPRRSVWGVQVLSEFFYYPYEYVDVGVDGRGG